MAPTVVRSAESLRESVRGSVVEPDDPGYQQARRLYNGMIEKRPALIVRCRDVADVRAAIAFARSQQCEVAVRGGAHSGAGFGSVDDGLVLDLSEMNGVRVDPGARL